MPLPDAMRHLALALGLALSAVATPPVLGQELVRNGSFDRDLSGWDGSLPIPQYGVGEPAWVAGDDARANARSGSVETGWFCNDIHGWCFRLWLGQCIVVRPGGTYRLSVSERGSGEISAGWYSSPDCTTGDLGEAGGAILNNETWARWEKPVTAPSDAHSIWLELEGRVATSLPGEGGSTRWDDASLQVISEPAPVSKSLLIPTAANAGSLLGAVFKTRLTLVSLGSGRPSSVRLQVLPSEGKVGPSRTILLEPGAASTFEDILGELGYEGGAAIEATYGEDQPLFATAEVHADTVDGRYSTPVPVLGDPSSGRSGVTPGISSTATSRTNVGCANVGEGGKRVLAVVHAADGAKLGTVELVVPGRGWAQKAVPFPASGGYVRWGYDGYMRGQAPDVSCFAIVVDNATNDGSLFR